MVFLCLSARSFFFTESKARALGWSTARRSTYGLNVYLQAVDHTTQRITLYAEILGSSNLIILLLQDCKNEALFELTHRLRVANTILVHMQYEICELNLHDEFSHHYFLLAHVSLDRPCRVGRQRNSQRAMWFIASGLQPSKNGRRKNCAVEFQSALSAQQSWSYSFAGRIFARCTVKITKHPPYRRQELAAISHDNTRSTEAR